MGGNKGDIPLLRFIYEFFSLTALISSLFSGVVTSSRGFALNNLFLRVLFLLILNPFFFVFEVLDISEAVFFIKEVWGLYAYSLPIIKINNSFLKAKPAQISATYLNQTAEKYSWRYSQKIWWICCLALNFPFLHLKIVLWRSLCLPWTFFCKSFYFQIC